MVIQLRCRARPPPRLAWWVFQGALGRRRAVTAALILNIVQELASLKPPLQYGQRSIQDSSCMKFKISATLKGPGGVPGAGFEKLLDHTGVPKLRVWVCRYGMKANATRGQNSAWSFADARAAFSKLRESAGSLESRIWADSGVFDKY